jgi:hypothetical protein
MNGKKIGIGAIVVILCAVAFYFCYWTKTPTYSIGIVREAIASHDVIKFQKHVNTKNLLSEAFDSILVAQEEITGESFRHNRFAMAIVANIKPSIVDALEDELIDAVEGKAGEPKKKDMGIVDGAVDNVKNAEMEIKSMSVKNSSDGLAYVDLNVYVPAAEQELVMTVKMSELADGTWRVEEITNLDDFLVEIENAKIRNEYKKAENALIGEWKVSFVDNPDREIKEGDVIVIKENSIAIQEKPYGEWGKPNMPFAPDQYESNCKVQFTGVEKLGTGIYDCAIGKTDGAFTMTLILHGSNGRIFEYIEAVKQ